MPKYRHCYLMRASRSFFSRATHLNLAKANRNSINSIYDVIQWFVLLLRPLRDEQGSKRDMAQFVDKSGETRTRRHLFSLERQVTGEREGRDRSPSDEKSLRVRVDECFRWWSMIDGGEGANQERLESPSQRCFCWWKIWTTQYSLV